MAHLRGFTLVEAVVTIFILGTISGIFASAIFVTRAARHASDAVTVDLFLASVLDRMEHAYPENLSAKTASDIIGLAYNVGIPAVVEGTNPPSGTQVLSMEPVTSVLGEDLSSLALMKTAHADLGLTADLRVDPASGAGWSAGLVIGFADPENYHRIRLESGSLVLERVAFGTVGLLDSVSVSTSPGTWFTLDVQVVGTQIDVDLDGSPALSASDPLYLKGQAGIVGYGASTTLAVDDLSVSGTDAFTEDFEGIAIGEAPDIMIMNAPYHLKDFSGQLDIVEYDEIPDIFEVTASASWTAEGDMRSRTLSTLMFIE